MQADDFTLKVRRFKPRDRRLGRNVVHDSRSLRFLVRAADPATLTSVRHTVNIPILDQGNVGSCTGHAATAALASATHWEAGQHVLGGDAEADHKYAVGVYSDATILDPWPGSYQPDDTGSDGLSVAKVLQQRSLISGYVHAFSLEAALTALADGPVIVGTNWLRGMFDPLSSGQIQVTGPVDGGHEYCLDEIDVERKRAWIRQSWGASWGVAGRAWLTWDDLGTLLAADGDCTVLVPASAPAPQPAPVPPPAVDPREQELVTASKRWLKSSSAGPHYMKTALQNWLTNR